MKFDIDTIIFLVYIAINVGVGLYLGRGVKNIKDYALGGRNFSTGTLVSTIMAAWLGGDYLFITLAQVYTTGLHYAVACTGMAFGLLLVARVFVPRMGEFLGNISVASAMGNLYGPRVRLIAAVTGAIVAAGFIAVQFKVFGDLFKHYVGISDKYTIFIAGTVVVMYSAFGGIRSVAFTDIIQFFTFGILIPVLSMILWNEYVGVRGFSFANATSSPLFDYREFIGLSNHNFWSMVVLFLLFVIPGFDPTLFQRISIGRSVAQVKSAFTISSILLLFILLGMSWIGFLLFNVDNTLQPENLVHYIINNHAHTGLKGFILIGIVAMCMSNADANINAASVVLTHDFCDPLGIKLRSELFLSKTIAITLGCGAIFLASLDYDLLSLVFLTQSFNMPIVAVPLMLAILGFRSTEKAVLIGMAVGFITVIVWRAFFMDATGVDSIVPGMLGNIIFFMGSHYILRQSGGWIGIKDKAPLVQAKLERERKWNRIAKSIQEFSFLQFCKNNAPKQERTYVAFGIFCLISTTCTMYSIPSKGMPYENVLLFFYETMLMVSVLFTTYYLWPASLRKDTFVHVFWNISILYVPIICSTFFVMLSNFGQLQMIIFLVNLISVATLLRWQVAIIMIPIVVFAAIEFFESSMGIRITHANIVNLEFKITYLLILLSGILIMFFKPKQEEHDLTEAQKSYLGEKIQSHEKELQDLINLKSEFLRNLNHEVQTPVTGITSMGQALLENYDNLSESQRKDYIKIIAQSSERFKSYTNNILDLSKLSSLNYTLNMSDVNLSDLVYERLENCIKLYLDGKNLEFVTQIEEDVMLKCDRYYIQIVLDNLIINSINYSKEGKVTIILKNLGDKIEFSIQDEGMGIPKRELFDVFEAFTVSSKTKSIAGGRGVGLALCKKSIEAHSGKIWAESDGEKGAIFRFEIAVAKG